MDLSIIRERMQQLETLKDENKIARESLKNELENDTDYLACCEELRAVLDKRKRIREAIWAKTETQKIVADIKENNEEIGSLQDILSVELMEYYSEKKVDEIEDSSGEQRKFKVTVKILPKKNKYGEREYDGKFAAKIDPENVENSDQ